MLSRKVKVKLNGKKYIVNINPKVTMDDYYFCVDEIADMCFVDGEFAPGKKAIAEMICITAAFTDFPISEFSKEELWDILYYSKVYKKICKALNRNRSTSLICSDLIERVDEKIEYNKQKIYNKSSLDNLFDSLSKSLDANSKSMGDIDVDTVNKALTALSKMTEKDIAGALVGVSKQA